MKCAGPFQTRKAIQGEPGERKFGQRRQIVDVGTGAVDVQMSEPVLTSQEVRIPQNSVVPDGEGAQSPGKQGGTELGGVGVAHDLDAAPSAEGAQFSGVLRRVDADVEIVCGEVGDDLLGVSAGVEPVPGPGELGTHRRERVGPEAGEDGQGGVGAHEGRGEDDGPRLTGPEIRTGLSTSPAPAPSWTNSVTRLDARRSPKTEDSTVEFVGPGA